MTLTLLLLLLLHGLLSPLAAGVGFLLALAAALAFRPGDVRLLWVWLLNRFHRP